MTTIPSRLVFYQFHHHFGHVSVPEPISLTGGMGSYNCLGLNHVLKQAPCNLFGLNERGWFSKGELRYSYWKKISYGGKDVGLKNQQLSTKPSLTNPISPVETLLILQGLSQESPFKVIPDPLSHTISPSFLFLLHLCFILLLIFVNSVQSLQVHFLDY